MLTDEQIGKFWRDGVLIVPNAVTSNQLAALRVDMELWVEEWRSHDGPY